MEYQRSLYEADLPVDVTTQSTLLQFLNKTKQFQYLQMMLQYQCFNESLEVAQNLTQVYDNGCTTVFQWMIDIYHRLKRPNDVVKILLSSERIKEILLYVEQFRVKGVRVKDVLEVVRKFPGSIRSLYVDYFVRIIVCFVVY